MANVEKYLDELDDACWQFPNKKAYNPFIWDYAPEMEYTPDLEQYLESWYQFLIGMLRWMVEIC